MRPIKFRGKHTVTGRFVYGNLLFDFGVTYVGGWEVDPNSVAQLVGYDANGNEVYEGDIVVDDIAEYVTHLFPNIRISECKLKEAKT